MTLCYLGTNSGSLAAPRLARVARTEGGGVDAYAIFCRPPPRASDCTECNPFGRAIQTPDQGRDGWDVRRAVMGLRTAENHLWKSVSVVASQTESRLGTRMTDIDRVSMQSTRSGEGEDPSRPKGLRSRPRGRAKAR
jgi:hypothetical protein